MSNHKQNDNKSEGKGIPFIVQHPQFHSNHLVAIAAKETATIVNLSTGAEVFKHTLRETQKSIHCAAFHYHQSTHFFVIGSDSKHVLVFVSEDGKKWSLKLTSVCKKKITGTIFVVHPTQNTLELLFADKFGDVYSIEDVGKYCKAEGVVDIKEPTVKLGQYSPVTHMLASKDDKYVFTSDKDGRVRVSNYPNLFDIHSYCLGHSTVVSCINVTQFDASTPLLISGSGDNTVRIFNYLDEKKTNVHSVLAVGAIPAHIDSYISASDNTTYVAISFEQAKEIALYKLVKNEQQKVALQEIQRTSLSSEVFSFSFVTIGQATRLLVITAGAPHIQALQFAAGQKEPLSAYTGSDIGLPALNTSVGSISLAEGESFAYWSAFKKVERKPKERVNKKRGKETAVEEAAGEDTEMGENQEDKASKKQKTAAQ